MSTVDYSTRICCTYMIIIKYLYTCLDKAFHLSNCDWKQDQVMRARADVEVGLGIIMVVGVQTWFDGSSVIELYLSQRSQKGLKCVSCHDHTKGISSYAESVIRNSVRLALTVFQQQSFYAEALGMYCAPITVILFWNFMMMRFGGDMIWHDQAEWWRT